MLGDFGNPQTRPCMTLPWARHDASGNHCDPKDSDTKCGGDEAFPVVDTNYMSIVADAHIQQRKL